MLHNPSVIFLDEPTAGISPSSRILFWNLIRKLSNDGKTIFVTTHYMDEAEYCGRIALMQAGKIIGLDSPSELKRRAFKNPLYEIEIQKNARKDFETHIFKNRIGHLSVYGMRYHLELCEGKTIGQALENEPNAEYKKIEPSLEDVFIKIMGGEKQ
jgi:ABC-2 type transport system ATP-binding protein